MKTGVLPSLKCVLTGAAFCAYFFASSPVMADPPKLRLFYDNGSKHCDFQADYMGLRASIADPLSLYASGTFLACGDQVPFGAVSVTVSPSTIALFQHATVTWNAPGATICRTTGSSLPASVPQWPLPPADLCIGTYECKDTHSFDKQFMSSGTYTFVLSCKAPGHINDPHTATAVLHVN